MVSHLFIKTSSMVHLFIYRFIQTFPQNAACYSPPRGCLRFAIGLIALLLSLATTVTFANQQWQWYTPGVSEVFNTQQEAVEAMQRREVEWAAYLTKFVEISDYMVRRRTQL